MIDNKDIWIKTGYEIFSISGYNSLKIEQLAKKVGISKSSFYHHFADIDCFIEILFNYHLKMCSVLAEKERNCIKIHSELIYILIEHKTDLLFNRQLRIHRNLESMKNVFLKSNEILGNYAIMLWAKEINLELNKKQLEALFEIATDDFYMQMNSESINFKYLTNYFQNLNKISKQFV